ncbi:DUF4386 domain-containing protein [Jannaschia pohangensis]|uniref:DUF4386 domain-containing protein n=1 Tax=Jannaschia pohangensis TaxID=390807 RepID=A0A1I3UZF9_9RHOB|nr:DUF4386 domain-containing protein [Jannaschia pohangensis]SFJ87456.1 protein of unknown function [Jannaschia pohangensis]
MNTLSISPQQSRFAGVCYLVIILCGVGSEVALRGPLIDFGSAEQTMQAINAEHMRFRLSIMADVVMALADAALAVLLFLMFRSVSAGLALGALVFRLLQSGLIAAGLLNLQAALFFDDAEHALSFMALHAYGYDLGLIFFAVNCFLTAVLIVRSGFVPRFLGIGIGLSGVVYLTGSVLRFVAPDMHGFIAPAYVLPLIAETAFCLWLLVLPRQSRRTATA